METKLESIKELLELSEKSCVDNTLELQIHSTKGQSKVFKKYCNKLGLNKVAMRGTSRPDIKWVVYHNGSDYISANLRIVIYE